MLVAVKSSFMSYKLAKLEHAELVKEAIEIMKPILKDVYRINDVQTNSADCVEFLLSANGEIKGTVDLYALTKPYPSGQRVEVYVNFESGIKISFYNVLSNRGSIILLINKNGEQRFVCCL